MTAADQLAATEVRVEKAVDLGPWSAKHPPSGDSWIAIERPNGFTNVTAVVAKGIDHDDAEFIANAPADVAYLLATIREQAAKLEAVEADIDGELQDAEPSNYEEDNYDAGYIAGLTYAQDLLRAALVAGDE